MRPKRFIRLRRRLSYANVMATLAFFFALTGASMAGVKYIAANDTIPATSDLAGSTYGNPLIAAGKITSSKFAPTAKAPDADKLDGQDSSAFPTIVARGTVSISSGTIYPGICGAAFADVPAADPTTDYVLVNRVGDFTGPSLPGRIEGGLENVFTPPDTTTPDVVIRQCNDSDSAQTLGGDFRYVVFR